MQAQGIHHAVKTGDLTKVRELIETDTALLELKGNENKTPLNLACGSNQAIVANYLLDMGANINTKSYFYEYTPLLSSCMFRDSDFELIQRLINMGADVNTQGYNGVTPLHRSAQAGNLRIAKLLLNSYADPNIYDKFKGTIGHAYPTGTPLQFAINYENVEMTKFLVENGANLNQKDAINNTELHLSALKGYTDLTQFLITHGSNVNAVNTYNHTALYYAAKHGHRGVADVLIAAGAKKSTIVETNYGKATQLTETLKEGEAYLWYLNYGFAVKTKENLLLFNPPAIDESLEASLSNGHLNPNELAGQKIIIFIDRNIEEETCKVVLAKRLPNAQFVFNKGPIADKIGSMNISSYHLANPNENFSIGLIQVHAIPAVFGGLGYLVEVDGVKVFNAGCHLSDNTASNVANFRKEIDFLKPYGPIDIGLLYINSHRYYNEPVFEHYLYLIDQLSPKAIYLMGGNVFEQLTKCTKVLQTRKVIVEHKEGMEANGERFHYRRDLVKN